MDHDRLTTRDDTTTYRPSRQERGVVVAEVEKPAAPSPKPPAKVPILYLHHSKGAELDRDKAFGRLRYPGAKSRQIANWKQLGAQLKANTRIGTLVLMTHGMPGQLLLDTAKGGADAGAFMAKAGAHADTIVFEGCMVMREPVDAAEMAKGVQASSAVGYNWWHYTGRHTFKLTGHPMPSSQRDEITAWVKSHAKYLIRSRAGGLNQLGSAESIISELEKGAKKNKAHELRVYLEWFFPTGGGGNEPNVGDPVIGIAADPARSELKKKTITTRADADAFKALEHFKEGAFEVTLEVAKIV